MKKDFISNLLKTITVFLCYFLYSNVISTVLTGVGIFDKTLISFISDFIFLIGIIYVYKNELNNSLIELKKNLKFSDVCKKLIFWVLIIFIFNVTMGIITDIIWPNNPIDNNTETLSNIGNVFYKIFKTMIFAVIAEELVYRVSIREIISNKIVFIVVSAIIYTLMVYLFAEFENKYVLLDFITYFLPALIFSLAYVKNKDNIIIFMLIKFIYQLIPLTLMFFTM